MISCVLYSIYRMVEGELFPCLGRFGLRFYAYNPVSIPTYSVITYCTIYSWQEVYWLKSISTRIKTVPLLREGFME